MPRYIFAVECAERSTGRPYTIEVEADSDRNAIFAATSAGAVTSGARLAKILPDPPAPPAPVSHSSVPGIPDPRITDLSQRELRITISSGVMWGHLRMFGMLIILTIIAGIIMGIMNSALRD
jgi:hypothetical protein